MAEVKLDTLELEIRDNAKQVSDNLSKLQKKIDGLGLKNAERLESLNTFLKEIKNNSEDSGTGEKLKSLASALLSLSKVPSLQLRKTDANTIASLGESIKTLPDDFSKLSGMAKALNGLKELEGIKIGSFVNSVRRLPEAIANIPAMEGETLSKITGLATVLKTLGEAGGETKSFNKFVTKLAQFPEAMKGIMDADLEGFGSKIQQLHTIIKPFADDMEKIAAGFAAMPSKIQKLITSTENYNATVKRGAGGIKQTYESIATGMRSFTKAVTFAFVGLSGSKFFQESSSYVETLNLFHVTMRQFADSAYEYAEKVQDLMGIDIKEWLTYQGEFMNLAKGYGIVAEKANVMSQNLTQLAYDLSSVYNTDVETAFTKLQSAMSGQVKSLKVWGVDVGVASMKQYMLAQGMTESWNQLSVGTQALLRYNYILEKTTAMQGDLGRTLLTPANAVRILKAQITQLERAIGNIISLVVTKAMPYMQAFVELVKEAANELAELWGYDPNSFVDWDNLDSTGFAEDMEDANESAQELKRTLLGFDEINKLSDNNSGKGGMLNPEDLGINPNSYDFLTSVNRDAVDRAKEQLQGFVDFMKGVVGTLGGFVKFLSDKILPVFDDGFRIVSGFLALFSAGQALKGNKFAAGFFAIVGSLSESVDAGKKFYDVLTGDGSVGDAILDLVGGVALGAIGGAMVGGPVGALVGGLGALATAFFSAMEEHKNFKLELLYTDIFDNNGIAIEELQERIEKYTEKLGLGKKEQQEWINKIEASEKAYKNARDEYDLLWQTLDQKSTWDTEDIDDLAQAFNDLAASIIAVRDTRIDSVMQNISNAIKNNISPELNNMLGDLSAKIEEFRALSDISISELQQEYNDILKEIKAKDGYVSEEQSQRLAQITQEITGFEMLENPELDTWNAAGGILSRSVSVGTSPEEATQRLNDFIAARDDYIKTLSTKFEQDKRTLDYMISQDKWGIFGDEQEQQSYRDALAKSFNDQLKKVYDQYNFVLDKVRSQLTPELDKLESSAFYSSDWARILDKFGSALIPGAGIVQSAFEMSDYFSGTTDAINTLRKILELIDTNMYAAGGFPEDGLFFANSTELVGRFTNGRTAVANNEQIIEGIKRGVAEANRESGGGGNWTIQILDPNGNITGETIITAAERRNRRDGKTVISIGAY